MINKYSNLYATILTRPDEYGYKYLVKNSCSNSVTAFRTAAGFKKWLTDTGLRIEEVRAGCMGARILFLKGTFYRNCHMLNTAEFLANFSQFEPTIVLSNGDYVPASIQVLPDNEGRVIHYQNPNTDRLKIEYSFANWYLGK